MKIPLLPLVALGLSGFTPVMVPAQTISSNTPPSSKNPLPSPKGVDAAWTALLNARNSIDQLPARLHGSLAALKQARATQSKALADQAKSFYLAQPNNPQAAEARKLEIFSLIQVQADGDDGVAARLDKAVSDLRADTRIPSNIRARGAAAREFTRALQNVNDPAGRMAVTEKTARSFLKEFPSEAPGYEALFAVCQGADQTKSANIARELISSDAPAEIKSAAQILLDRYALVGRPVSELLGADHPDLLSALTSGAPAMVYSWSTVASGSIDLGRMIQARRFPAIGICLDTDIETARKTAHDAGLGGRLCYDPKGTDGPVTAQLRLTSPGQIYLVDSAGIIRDVRGGDNLEGKLQNFGFKTPVLVRP